MSEPETTTGEVDVVTEVQERVLLALRPDELAAAHGTIRKWATGMESLMRRQAEELDESVQKARANKWGVLTLQKHLRIARQRRAFYRKIVAAVDAGYLIVPNFPMDPWVVRTDRKNPSGGTSRNSYSADRWFPQKARLLPEGEGRYVARSALLEVWDREEKAKDGEEKTFHYSRPSEFDESPEFPFAFAAPYVMDRVAAAQEERIFDEIGVAEEGTGDPILLGRLLNPRPGSTAVTFFLAWGLDLRRV